MADAPDQTPERVAEIVYRTTMDREFVICPACGYRHGDAWEWAAQEESGDRMECEGCGVIFIFWSEHDVTYHAKVPDGTLLRLLTQPQEPRDVP